MQLYVIRHAQSENNALWTRSGADEGRVPDPALTDVGHDQAKRLADHLVELDAQGPFDGYDPQNRRGFHFTHLYTSLMTRAVQTGLYLSQALDIPLQSWEEIHEWGGIFEKDVETGERVGLPGPNRAYFAAQFPTLQLPDYLGETGWWNRPFETAEQGRTRTQAFLAQLMERHGDTEDRVAIVTHGGFTFSLLQTLAGFPRMIESLASPRRIWFLKNNSALSRINFGEQNVDIIYLNRVAHLPTTLIT